MPINTMILFNGSEKPMYIYVIEIIMVITEDENTKKGLFFMYIGILSGEAKSFSCKLFINLTFECIFFSNIG